MDEWTVELEDWIEQRSIDAGFDQFGVAGVGDWDESHNLLDAERFAAWVDAGRAGEMEYLKRRDEAGVLLRSAVQVAIPWARSVMVCAMNYNSAGPLSIGGCSRRGRDGLRGMRGVEGLMAIGVASIPTDYHDELLGRLRRIEAALRSRVECETRCYVDTGPLVERTMAVQGGSGVDWEEYVCAESGAGLVAAAGSDCDFAVGRAGACRCGSLRTVWKLYAVYRCLSYGRAGGSAGDGCCAVHCLSDDREEGRRLRRSCGSRWGGRCLGAISVRMFVRGTGGLRWRRRREC